MQLKLKILIQVNTCKFWLNIFFLKSYYCRHCEQRYMYHTIRWSLIPFIWLFTYLSIDIFIELHVMIYFPVTRKMTMITGIKQWVNDIKRLFLEDSLYTSTSKQFMFKFITKLSKRLLQWKTFYINKTYSLCWKIWCPALINGFCFILFKIFCKQSVYKLSNYLEEITRWKYDYLRYRIMNFIITFDKNSNISFEISAILTTMMFSNPGKILTSIYILWEK